MDFAILSRFDMEHKLIVMKVLANSFARLAEHNVVHADVKPDNLLIKQTNGGFFTMKIIDFDASYLADYPPDPDEIQGDTVYYAPETLLYIIGECDTLTPKVDVFAMGIIFHQLLTGHMPVIKPEYDYIYESILSGDEPKLDPALPEHYRQLLVGMLQKEPENRLSMQQVLDLLSGFREKDLAFKKAESAAPKEASQANPGLFSATDDDLW
jgi:serine/threonine protein kinase